MKKLFARPSRGALALLVSSIGTTAHGAGIPTLQEVTVSTSKQDLIGVADSATEGTVTAAQLRNRPLLRPAEALETVPGMIVTQHSGDGKANQYFLRGFNLDHGSDFATSLLGMPVNMASHAHGQGYMDLNFLIPELVQGIAYRKGPNAAEDGDFATTGSALIDYRRKLDGNFVDLGLGQNGYQRILAAGSRALGAPDSGDSRQLLAAVELMGNDGPWEQPENLVRRNAVLRLSDGTSAHGYAITAMAYSAAWTATEHVPQRAITRGEIGRYGALSARDGGRTHRHSLSAEWGRLGEATASKANAYVIDYGLNLFSAPSGYINGLQGDQHEQADRRFIWGGDGRHAWFLGPAWRDTELAVGAHLRQDRIGKVGLYSTVDRARTATVREDRITETSLGVFAEARTQWTRWLRSTAALRRDELRADVTPLGGPYNMDNRGHARAGQTSPKVGFIFGPFNLAGATEFYANWGHGFHSNDARGATSRTNPADGSALERVPLIVKAKGSEIGLRAAPLPGWNTSISMWQMNLASELVFIGDEGITEPKGASRRHGLEWANYITPTDGLIIDADLALSKARFKDAAAGADRVPNAIPVTASVGVAVDRGGPWHGGLRLRYLGAYPLEETGEHKSTPFWTANLKLAYRASARVQFSMDVLNLFNRHANDIEYWGGACTRSETLGGSCNGGIDGRLVHPLEPRSLRLGLRIGF
ncbi:TonB-dependent receptor [Zoogloea sp.]|uniref:TonB-dependent receptor n=1 Tax=Zoogloea sp. TaxID=49181 RepID=UPI0035B4485B